MRGYEFEGYERTIDSHVKNLRRKIETDPQRPGSSQTVLGAGYRLGLRRDATGRRLAASRLALAFAAVAVAAVAVLAPAMVLGARSETSALARAPARVDGGLRRRGAAAHLRARRGLARAPPPGALAVARRAGRRARRP